MTTENLRPLTAKEKLVLEFIESYFLENMISPSFTEIKSHFGFASNNSVQRYLKQLQNKGYIHIPPGNQKRAISILFPADTLHSRLTSSSSSSTNQGSASPQEAAEPLSLPLLGKIAAGLPIEALEYNESVAVPYNFVKKPQESYVLKVEGDSMIDEGIHSGDLIVVENTNLAENGDIVVAVIENEATLKRFYFHRDKNLIELRPANAKMESMWHPPESVIIRGLLKNLIRKY